MVYGVLTAASPDAGHYPLLVFGQTTAQIQVSLDEAASPSHQPWCSQFVRRGEGMLFQAVCKQGL
jgi:hypothetical protein